MELSLNIQMSWTLPRTAAPALPVATEPPAAQDDNEEVAATEPKVREDDHGWSRGDHEHHRHPTRGRRHVQRDARHLLRDIRHDVRGELKELRETGDTEKIAAVKTAYRDFRSEVREVLQGVGRGREFDRSAVAEGLGAAMASFTATLRELNGTVDEPTPTADKTPAAEVDLPMGAILDVGA